MPQSIQLNSPVAAQAAFTEAADLTDRTGIAVSLNHVTKLYDGHAAVDDLSLEVRKGEFLAILGPSGSGKTTAMRMIGGFETPEHGKVIIDGKDVTADPAENRPVNTVFQSYALFPHMSVLDNVAFGPRMKGLSKAKRRAKAGELLDLVHLSHAADKHPNELSGGMQQRVALARALANDPTVLLLDEPLGALDRKLRDEMQRELRRVQTELKATFVYVTHDQEEAFGMADRLAVMRNGRFEQIDVPAAVYDRPENGWIALFVGTANTFRAMVVAGGAPAQLTSPLGPVAAGFLAPGLSVGDTALIAVRPEATHFTLARPGEDAPNAISARLTDKVTIGPNLRLRAEASDGTTFESVLQRGSGPLSAEAANIGDAILVTFSPDSARAYHDEPTN